MKKINSHGFSTVAGLIIIFVALIGFTGGYVYKSNNKPASPANASQTTDDSSESAAKIAILGHGFEAAAGGSIEVPVTLKNNDSVSHDVTVKVTFKNIDGQTLEIATGTLKDLKPGETKELIVLGTDKVASFSDIKVEIDKVL